MAHIVIARRGSRSNAREPLYVEQLLAQITLTGLPTPEREHVFHPSRKWRLDIAWPAQLVGAEVDGAIWSGGRHVRGQGYENDARKLNHALVMGWRVLRFTGAMVESGEALDQIAAALALTAGRP